MFARKSSLYSLKMKGCFQRLKYKFYLQNLTSRNVIHESYSVRYETADSDILNFPSYQWKLCSPETVNDKQTVVIRRSKDNKL